MKNIANVDGESVARLDPQNVFDAKLYKHIVKVAQSMKDEIKETAAEWQSVQEIMEYAVSHLRSDWMNAKDELPKVLSELRGSRMALSSEVKQMKSTITDLGEFVEAPDTARQLKSIRETVELLERLEKLKASGLFDKVLEGLLKCL